MKNLRIVLLLLTVVLLGSMAMANTGDWEAVKALSPGTRIKVSLKHGRGNDHCILKETSDDGLSCGDARQGTLSYRRDDLRAIYLNPTHARHASGLRAGLAGAGLFVPALIVGVVAGPVPVVVGAGVMGGTCLLAKPFVHGKTIYRSPRRPSRA